MEHLNNPSFKIILLGDTGVGKTSLTIRQTRHDFSFQRIPTVGTTHFKTFLKLNGVNIELKIWDTAGQEQYAPLVKIYSRGASACIIVASFLDIGTINNIKIWQERLNETGEYPPIIVAINKTDMEEGAPLAKSQIHTEYLQNYRNSFFVSAKTGDGVEELFSCAASEAWKNEIANNPTSHVKMEEESQKGGICC